MIKMAEELITNPNCKHKWIKRKSIHPFTKQILASWEWCEKCGSEKLRRVGS
jgi:hypothetical protein